MKRYKNIKFAYIFIAIIALFSFSDATAQNYKATDGSIWYEGSLKPSMNVVFDYDNTKVLANKWETFLQTKKGVDLDEDYSRLGKTMMSSDWVTFRDITLEPIRFHTQFIRHANNTEMNIFVDFGNGYFMNPYVHEQEYENTRLLVSEFMNYFRADEISASKLR